MQFIIDHITGVVIAAIVVMIIAVTQFRSSESSIGAAQYAAAKTRMLDVAQYVEQDFTNIGSGVDTVANAIQSFDTVSAVKHFQFLGRIDIADPTVHTIRYQWEETGSAIVQGNTVPAYTVERRIDGTVSGTSPPTITDFRIDLMTGDSVAVTSANFPDTRIVAVWVTSVSPLGPNKTLEQTRWRKIFRPVNMTRTFFP